MGNSSETYHVGAHSCYLLQYHLVFVTKYRRPVIVDALKTDLIQYAESFFSKQRCTILEINTDRDHIHILFEAPPTICLSALAGSFKASSSRHLRARHKDFLARYYWKPLFWSDSWFVATVSERSADIVSRYIQNQGR